MSRTRHGAFTTFRRRIFCGGYIAWRILRSGTLEGPAGWSFDPSAEGAMTTARPPLTLLICPCLSCCQRDRCTSPCCRRRSSTVRTLCSRREEWDHDPPTVLSRNLRYTKKNSNTFFFGIPDRGGILTPSKASFQ